MVDAYAQNAIRFSGRAGGGQGVLAILRGMFLVRSVASRGGIVWGIFLACFEQGNTCVCSTTNVDKSVQDQSFSSINHKTELKYTK